MPKGLSGKDNPSYSHGQAHKPIYSVYRNMIDRCHCPKDHNYQRYGARGIKVCNQWRQSKKAFFDWAYANGYEKGLSLDRIDVNGDYCPENCRWATPKQQANNKRTNHFIVINGERHTISEWAEISGILKTTLRERISRGWEGERLLLKPNEKIHKFGTF